MKPARTTPKLSVLLYHRIGPAKTRQPHFCDIDRFRSQMRWLRASGHHVVSLEDACAGLFRGAPLPERPVVITFDDGFQDFHDHAFPVLRDFHYPAVVYVVAGLLGQAPKWLSDVESGARIMSADMLRTVHAGGIEIGAHTLHHARLTDVTENTQISEITASKRVLEDALGKAVRSFAYPFGSYNPSIRDAVANAGFDSGLTINRGLANWAPNPYEIPRKAISWGDNAIGFFYKLLFDNTFKRRPKAAV